MVNYLCLVVAFAICLPISTAIARKSGMRLRWAFLAAVFSLPGVVVLAFASSLKGPPGPLDGSEQWDW